jgi:hypothetical protein
LPLPTFEPDHDALVDIAGSGERDLPAFRAADYRLLVVCHGDPLAIVSGGHEVTRTKCDGVLLDAKVYADEGTKVLRVVGTPRTSWDIRVGSMAAAP